MSGSAAELLETLQGLGIELNADGDKLRYRAPEGALTHAFREQIVEHKQEILDLLRGRRAAPPPLTRRPRGADDRAPLSFGQERVWFLDQLEPGNPVYNVPLALHLAGSLDLLALRRSIDQMVRRHQILRTTFTVVDGRPMQSIAPSSACPGAPRLATVDLRALPDPLRARACDRLIDAEARWPFDLAHGPLLRPVLLRLGEQDHVLSLTMHHIITDMWSMGLFVGEVSALYQAYVGGARATLPDLPLQYADYAAWQRMWLQGSALEAQLGYWKRQLGAGLPLLELPADYPRPPVQTFRGASLPFALPLPLTAAIRAQSQRAGVTLFMLLLAAFQTLLVRYTGQTESVVGTSATNRNRVELERLIGFFANTLVMRTDLAGNPTFRAALARVREVTLDAYAHQDAPFEQVVEALRPERSLSHTPLFQALFALQTAPVADVALPGLRLNPLMSDSGTSKFDLTLSLRDGAGGLHGVVEYSADLFEAATIARLAGHFQMLLTGIAADLDRRIADLPLLTEAERIQLLVEWNAARPGDRGQASEARSGASDDRPLMFASDFVHARFAEQTARAPDAVALVFDDPTNDAELALSEASERGAQDGRASLAAVVQLTYAALDRRANQIAHELRSRGVGPDVRVGVYLERSPEMLAAILGVFKAGGSYVPIDPHYPAERIAYMLEDSQATTIVTKGESADSARGARRAARIDLLADRERIARRPATPPDVNVRPDNLAYVIYTSGSTGRPKGVQVTHRNVISLLDAARPVFQFGPADVWTVTHSYAFDLSVWEIWCPLLHGGRLAIVPVEVAQTPAALYELLYRQRVTVLNQTPSAFRQVLPMREATGRALDLRLLMCGGEPLPRDLAPELLAWRAPAWNFYGPTEATVWAAIHPVGVSAAETAPIGRPLANARIYLLDAHSQPVPIGVPGELHIGGSGLARGYLGRPDLTAERFIPDPFAQGLEIRDQGSDPAPRSLTPDPRLYRTGDLARWRPDGAIEFIARIDHQVKLRGYRIELGEIEAALAAHPAVREAAVIVREDAPPASGRPDRRLVAYVVPHQGSVVGDQESGASAPDARIPDPRSLIPELRAFLAQRLPAYMIPSAFVRLDALPRTSNSKLDRNALLALAGGARPVRSLAAPRTPIEEVLTSIWADVLNIPQAGIYDNFFEAGGHSLLATQLIARLRDALQVELPLRRLFQAPTVAELAALIAREKGKLSGPADMAALLPALVADAEQRFQPFPLTDVQQAYWVGRSGAFDLGNVAAHVYIEREILGLDLPRMERAWQRLIARHEMLRAIILPDGRQQILEHVPDYVIAVRDLSAADPPAIAAELAAVREELSHQVLAADQWPLFRIQAARLPGGRVRLHISFDLLIGDAQSFQILFREFAQLYQDPTADLPPLDLSFRDYVLAEQAMRDSELYQRSLRYWSERLATLPPAPQLPLAQSPALLDRPRFVRRSTQLDSARWRRIKSRTAAAGVTPAAALLTIYSDVLAAWSRNLRFTIDLTLFNRLPLHPQVNEIVGDFTSLTLLEVDAATPGAFIDRARRLQARLWDDLDHRYVSGVQVLRDLTRAQSSGAAVLMPVVFTSTLHQGATDLLDVMRAAGLEDVTAPDERYSITQTSQVWLDNQVTEADGALFVNWDAVEDLFPSGLMDDMFGSYCRFLGRLADDEASWRETASRHIPPEQLAMRASINATDAPFALDLLHALVSAQAARTPDAAAVSYDGASGCLRLTYAALERRANQIGRRLRELGARPGTLVGVVMEKGWEQVVGVLSALHSGAAYLPIDPGLPAERLRYLLDHGSVRLALTQSWVDARLDWPATVQRLAVDAADLDDLDDRPLAAIQQLTDLAYVIYTSGSTGQPKGVMIDHRGAANTILDVNQRFGVAPDDRVLALSALNFDLSVYDIFGTLAAGGMIVMPQPGTTRDPDHWVDLIQRNSVTIWNSVPALLEMLVAAMDDRPAAAIASLRLALLSGDWIPVSLPGAIRALVERIVVISMGGATEASIWSILHPIASVAPASASIPYGRPMANQRFYVLNAALDPCPAWAPGELYIGGAGLSLGYWRDPAKTAERFIPNPFSKGSEFRGQGSGRKTRDSDPRSRTPDPRLYRTGDLGRYLPDGDIEFLGRVDFQVKVQGHRIELGEIESALEQHPRLRAAVVAAVGDPRGNKRLVAYVVPAGAPSTKANGRAPAAPPDDAGDGRPADAPADGKTMSLNDSIEFLEFKLGQPGLRNEPDRAGVDLIKPTFDDAVMRRYTERRSQRQFLAHPLAFVQLSELLSCLLQVELEGAPFPKYQYASAGNLYPVQTYVFVKGGRVEGLAEGVYYYHPKEHRLILLSQGGSLDRRIHMPINQPIFDESAFSIFLIGQFKAISPIYRDLARDFCLLEAGYMSQLLMTSAVASRIGLCPVGNFDFEAIRERFALDETHALLHSLIGGPVGAPSSDGGAAGVAAPQPVVRRGAESPLSAELRGYLQAKLPEYMIPTTFVLLDALPLSPNGKVNRQALPAVDLARPGPDAQPAGPRSDMEQLIAGFWQEILQVAQVGLDDNFFELGGTSVHVIRIHNKLKSAFAHKIPIAKIYEHPTVRAMAQYLADAPSDSHGV